jgi:hypothetical protein
MIDFYIVLQIRCIQCIYISIASARLYEDFTRSAIMGNFHIVLYGMERFAHVCQRIFTLLFTVFLNKTSTSLLLQKYIV